MSLVCRKLPHVVQRRVDSRDPGELFGFSLCGLEVEIGEERGGRRICQLDPDVVPRKREQRDERSSRGAVHLISIQGHVPRYMRRRPIIPVVLYFESPTKSA